MTHLRKMMLEELERRNYAQTTIHTYIQTIEFKVYRIRTRENRPSGDVSYLKGNQLDSASV